MTIKKTGKNRYVLKSKTTGKVLGRHRSRAAALKQERAIQLAKKHKGGRK